MLVCFILSFLNSGVGQLKLKNKHIQSENKFEGRMWDLIVSVPDHCLSFYFICWPTILM